MEVGFGWPKQNSLYKGITYRTKTLLTEGSYRDYGTHCNLPDIEATVGNLWGLWTVEVTCS